MPIKAKGMVIVVTGPSAVGKGTICDALQKRSPDIKFSVSCTTRARRPHETEGVDYFFVTREEFERRIEAGELLEWAPVYGNFYGTPRAYVDEVIDNGYDIILDIDMEGARRVRDLYPGSVFVFVIPPTLEALRQRIKGRGTESDADVALRLEQAPKWIEEGLTYDYVIVNDSLEVATSHLQCIVAAERMRTVHQGGAQIRTLLEKGKVELA